MASEKAVQHSLIKPAARVQDGAAYPGGGNMLMLVLGRQQSSSDSKLDQVSLHGVSMVKKMSNMNREVYKLNHGGIYAVETVVCLAWIFVSLLVATPLTATA